MFDVRYFFKKIISSSLLSKEKYSIFSFNIRVRLSFFSVTITTSNFEFVFPLFSFPFSHADPLRPRPPLHRRHAPPLARVHRLLHLRALQGRRAQAPGNRISHFGIFVHPESFSVDKFLPQLNYITSNLLLDIRAVHHAFYNKKLKKILW